MQPNHYLSQGPKVDQAGEASADKLEWIPWVKLHQEQQNEGEKNSIWNLYPNVFFFKRGIPRNAALIGNRLWDTHEDIHFDSVTIRPQTPRRLAIAQPLIGLHQLEGGSTDHGYYLLQSQWQENNCRLKQPIFHLGKLLPSNVLITSDGAWFDKLITFPLFIQTNKHV